MEDEHPDLTPIPVEPRPLSSAEAEMVAFLLGDPFAVPALHAQAEKAQVVSRCGCGCASVQLEVAASAPTAEWDPADTPLGRSDWVPLTARGRDARGKDVEVTLHVTSGYLRELEIWTEEYGDAAEPLRETLLLDERLPVRTEYAVAHAVADRLRPYVPAGTTLAPERFGRIELRAPGGEPDSALGFGGVAGTARGLLEGVGWRLCDALPGRWLGCLDPEDEACPCTQARAELLDGDLRLGYGPREDPLLELPPVTREELERLEKLWSLRFGSEST